MEKPSQRTMRKQQKASEAASEAQETEGKDKEILALIQESKTTAKHEKERIREISKKDQKMHQRKKRKTRQEQIQKILEELKGTRNILSSKSVKKRIFIPKVKNNKGETIHTRQGIANVFAEFYESLYEGEEDDEEKRTESRTDEDERIPNQHDPIPECIKIRSKMPSTASKKEKQKTAVEYELNSSKLQ